MTPEMDEEPIDEVSLYMCNVCGNTKSKLEWDSSPDPLGHFKYQCSSCDHSFNDDELTEL